MPAPELTREAARQFTICNACRYCEGYCAVFPAMELRRAFAQGDVTYLAHLCHDCRDCFYACQYAPPHEFAINLPQVLAQVRRETYRELAWPGLLAAALFRRNRLAASLITVGSVALILLLVLAFQGPAALFGVHVGEGAFYRVVPYAAMSLPALVITAYGGVVFAVGAVRFWRETRTSPLETIAPAAFWQATQDACSLRYLGGGGAGCTYPAAGFSTARRWLHHLTFYGFLLDLASTTLAAWYHHGLGWDAPYPLWSWPVVLGSVGGVMLLLGTGGLLWLKWRSDRAPAERRMLSLDVAFLGLLFLTSLTGMVLLALRETALMGTLLVLHLGCVAGLFLTAPYGKFAHVVYRYAALVRHALEQRRAGPAGH